VFLDLAPTSDNNRKRTRFSSVPDPNSNQDSQSEDNSLKCTGTGTTIPWKPGCLEISSTLFPFSPSDISRVISPGLKIQLFLLLFFFSNKKNAVNWTVKPGQDPLNPVRIGYIDIKRYFRAIYLHK